jgi:crotonobetainyl-CoA:carnitine CoA-transferase CaiB-like acyl-CoA transferase
MPFLALQEMRVIDISTGIAGPFCAKLLADYGAEVIKVEQPGRGDTSRYEGPFPNGVPHPEKSALFLHLNTSKKGVTLDIESAAGQEMLRRLAAEGHILIESFSPGRLDSLGLGYEALKRLRSDLVMTSVTPFGQTGPHSDYQFTELTIFAMGGAMYREGLPDREPLKYGGEMAQYFAGTAAAAATMAASFGGSSAVLVNEIETV